MYVTRKQAYVRFVVSLFLMGVGFMISQSYNAEKHLFTAEAKNVQEAVEGTTKVVIDFGESVTISLDHQIDNATTSAYDLLSRIADEKGINLDVDSSSSLGVFVKSIGEKVNGEDNKYWQYLVNNEMPQIAADKYALKPGDVVEWRFAIAQ